MHEYIPREAAIDAVLDVYYDTPDIDLSGEKFEAAIFNIQAADVEPVRRGRWLVDSRTGMSFCPECLDYAVEADTNYCPNCGAKMDEEVWR